MRPDILAARLALCLVAPSTYSDRVGRARPRISEGCRRTPGQLSTQVFRHAPFTRPIAARSSTGPSMRGSMPPQSLSSSVMICSSRSWGRSPLVIVACLSRQLSHPSLPLHLPRLRESGITLRVVDAGTRSFRRKGVGLAGQDGKGGGDLGQPRADVGAGRGHGAGAPAGVLMPGVRFGDGEAEAALTHVSVVCRSQWVLTC